MHLPAPTVGLGISPKSPGSIYCPHRILKWVRAIGLLSNKSIKPIIMKVDLKPNSATCINELINLLTQFLSSRKLKINYLAVFRSLSSAFIGVLYTACMAGHYRKTPVFHSQGTMENSTSHQLQAHGNFQSSYWLRTKEGF